MRKYLGMAGVLAATLTLGACLEKETTHTLYLSPDGAVAWLAIERDVKSDGGDASTRSAEEAAYLASALAGTNDVAIGLAALEPRRVQTRVLRRERPFTVMTEARFGDVEELADRIIAAFHLPGDAYLTRDTGAVTLHIHIGLEAGDPGSGDDSAIAALLDELSAYRIVLTEGRFISAIGFTLDANDTVARPSAALAEPAAPVIDLSLTWK